MSASRLEQIECDYKLEVLTVAEMHVPMDKCRGGYVKVPRRVVQLFRFRWICHVCQGSSDFSKTMASVTGYYLLGVERGEGGGTAVDHLQQR